MLVKPKILGVLFIDRTGATLAPMAEAMLRFYGEGRFASFGAGIEPTGEVNKDCLDYLRKKQVPTDGVACRVLAAYQTPEQSVKIDVVIRLSNAVRDLPPRLYGVPAKADWITDDPADAGDTEQAVWMIRKAFTMLKERIDELLATGLPTAKGELQMAVQKIGGRF